MYDYVYHSARRIIYTTFCIWSMFYITQTEELFIRHCIYGSYFIIIQAEESFTRHYAYGPHLGDITFLEEVAKFLSSQYGDVVYR